MIERLLALSIPDLNALTFALQAGRVGPPYTQTGLQRVLPGNLAAGIAGDLAQLEQAGFTPSQIGTVLDLIDRDRKARPRLEDQLDLVTTGPEVQGVASRDTSVVVRELFASAMESVLIAGYAIHQGQRVFQALADRMQERPELQVRAFVDIQRGPGDTSAASQLILRFAARFRSQQWPRDRPLPAVYYDPRSLDLTAEKRTSMHAKCVVVDGQTTFVSSANFTEAAQQRNIEVGLLIRSAIISRRLSAFFLSMLDQKVFAQVL